MTLYEQEGLKKLNVLLDSNEFLQALDDNTLATPAAGKIKGPLRHCHALATCCLLSAVYQLHMCHLLSVAVGTWPGLCVTLVEYAAIEVTASVGKKKGPDAAIPKALRRFVQLADDDRRTGNAHVHQATVTTSRLRVLAEILYQQINNLPWVSATTVGRCA